MIRWAARATLAVLVFIPSLFVSVDIDGGGPLFWPPHPHGGHGNMVLGLFLLNILTMFAIAFVIAGVVAVLIMAAGGKFDDR